MSDPLSRATEALKDLHAEAPAPSPGTRELVLERATLGRRERRVSRAILMPLAAALILLATWAAASGALSRALSSRASDETVPREPTAPAASAAAPARPAEPAPAPPTPAEAPTTAEAPVAAPTSTPSATASQTSAPSTTAAPPRPAPAAPSVTAAPMAREPGDALYAVAHRAHFDDRDPARALVAWDAYLADDPRGPFAPEARYNRALCLVRLGRASEAAQALQPFADGAYGAYRAEESRKLLAALAAAAAR